jgi:serine protease Do
LTRLSLSSLLALLVLAGPAGSAPDDCNDRFIRAAGAVKDSVVSISIYEKKEGGERYVKVAYGSGTIIDGGYIVTNYHVVMKGEQYQVMVRDSLPLALEKFDNGEYFLADPKTDLAVLKIKEDDRGAARPVPFGDSNRLCEGEWVLAIGNPYGLHRTITSGIVSSKGRDNIGFADIEDFIQTDVPINPGNSGGPLINLEGKLVGINTAIRSESGGYQGISFAIPSNLVRQVCRELIENGRVRRGWIGFLVKERRTGPDKDEGTLTIISVIKNSPAEAAGLKVGDIVREVDGEKVSTLGGLMKAVGNKPVGTRIDIAVSRDGRLARVRLTLRERTVYKKLRKEMGTLFMRYGIEIDENSETGDVVISYVSPNSVIYNLKKGDVIASVNGKDVTSLDSFVRMFERQGRRITRMAVSRDSRLIEINFPE